MPFQIGSEVLTVIQLQHKNSDLHCKCLQGITGTLQGNRSAGISNLQCMYIQALYEKIPQQHLSAHYSVVRKFDSDAACKKILH